MDSELSNVSTDRSTLSTGSRVPPVSLNARLLSSRLHGSIGERVELCFQCQKCASGCPVSYAMDYTPPQILRMILLGLDEEVLGAKAPWFCASCETCTTRCPQGIDIAGIMDGVRSVAIAQGRRSPVPRPLAFYKSGLWNIRQFGRIYELGLVGMLKLRTREFMKDVDLGRKLFLKGKLRILPSIKGRRDIRKIFSRVKEKERAE